MNFSKRFFIVALALFLPLDSYAYIDPGAGSVLLQGIVGVFAAIFFAIKLYWHRLLKLLGFGKKKLGSERPSSDEDQI